MKNKLLLLIIATATLVSTSFATTSNFNKFTADTIPEGTTKKQEKKHNESFKDIEKDLDKLEGSSKSSDTTKIRIGKMNISVTEDGDDIIINKYKGDDDDWDWDDDDFSFGKKHDKNRFEPHWAGMGISMNGFLDASQQMEIPEGYEYLDLNTNKSIQFDLNFTQLGINIIKERVGLVTGVGFRWNNYRFSNSSVVLEKGENGIINVPDSSYAKSKLGVTYLTVPLLLEFQIPLKNEDLYISGGVEGAVKLTAKMKNKTDDGDKKKDKDDYYINPFTYNLTARVGFGDFGLYGTYQMQSLFKKDKGPELYPFALGITFNF
ncbi:MAG: outer membrane beta-barrel protein [Salinivirgaceae bacterium]|nr:outer membrane beta-barrel protein [Salinivirgaceae bacterium]